jgi:hypothetical protein
MKPLREDAHFSDSHRIIDSIGILALVTFGEATIGLLIVMVHHQRVARVS